MPTHTVLDDSWFSPVGFACYGIFLAGLGVFMYLTRKK